jgi:predicted nucleotidyltransferase
MSPLDLHHQQLERHWAEEQRQLERRRQVLMEAAAAAARALRERWPMLQGVWLFGSAQEPASFQRHSDLDLAVEGLPADAQGEALGVVEGIVDGALAAAGEGGIAIDVVRSEDLPPHWRERLRQRARALP